MKISKIITVTVLAAFAGVLAAGAPAARRPAKTASTAGVTTLDIFMNRLPPSLLVMDVRARGDERPPVIAERPRRRKDLPEQPPIA